MTKCTRLSPSLAGRAWSWYTQSLIPRLISSFYKEKSGYEATHVHPQSHTHLLDNLIILCQLIIVLPHQQHNESGFAPKERVKEGEKEEGW